jgi:hypothetical protein
MWLSRPGVTLMVKLALPYGRAAFGMRPCAVSISLPGLTVNGFLGNAAE